MKFLENDMRNMRKIMKEIFDKKQCGQHLKKKNQKKKPRKLDTFEISLLRKSSTNFLSMLNQILPQRFLQVTVVRNGIFQN